MPNLTRLLAAFTLTCLVILNLATTSRADPPPPAKEKDRANLEELRQQTDERSRTTALSHFFAALGLEKSDPRTARDHLEKCKTLLDDNLAWLPKSSFSRQERRTLSRQLAVKIRDLKAYEVHHADILKALDKAKALSGEDKFWEANKQIPRYREIRVMRMLNSTVSIDFSDVPIRKALDYLDDKAQNKLNFLLDEVSVNEATVDINEKTVTLKMTKCSVRAILKKMLKDAALDYFIEDGNVRITTLQNIQNGKVTRSHKIAGLLDSKNLEGSKSELLDALKLVLANAPDEAKFVVLTHNQHLIVQASVETQLQIERLLAELRGISPGDLDLSGIDLDNNNREVVP